MNLGDILVKLSAVLAVVAFVNAVRWARGNAKAERPFRYSYYGMTLLLVVASAVLMLAILRHDFRFDYVVGYSSRDLPLLYLISAFWAGQQGTYLLWGLVGALFGCLLVRKNAWEPAAVMAFYVPTVAFMHLLMLDPNGNPFKLAATVPIDGRGLNPLLQDPWMATHPPAIFVGYVAATVPAVLALVALVKRSEDKWVGPALRWTLLSFVLLGAGIVLGGFWAYKVLGWGGYWGWDPVENASLIPWIVVAALVHGLIVQKATGAIPRTNLALALAGYATVFYATFLTRSGVLADFSVHSFPAGSIYKILLGILLSIVAVSLVLFFRRWSIKTREIPLQLSWPLVLTVTVILFVLSAGLVLIGTSWPIITTWLGKPSSFGPSWYNTVSLPVYIALLALLGVAPFLAWGQRPLSIFVRRVIFSTTTAAVVTAVAIAGGSRGWASLALFFVAAAALAANTMRLVEIARVRMLNSGAALAHIGFALMLLGIVGSSFWGSEGEVQLPLGQPVELLGSSYTYLGHVEGSEPEDRWTVRIEESGSQPIVTEVAMYRTGSGQESQIMHKPAIVRRWSGDLYIAPAGIETLVEHQDLELAKGKPTPVGPARLTFLDFETHGGMSQQGMTVLANVLVEQDGRSQVLQLPLIMQGGQTQSPQVEPTIETVFAGLQLTRMAVEQGRILVHLDTPAEQATQILNLNVSTKPIIGLLWAGTMLLGVGCVVAWARRTIDERAIARAMAEAEAQQARSEREPTRTKKKGKKARPGRSPRPAHAR